MTALKLKESLKSGAIICVCFYTKHVSRNLNLNGDLFKISQQQFEKIYPKLENYKNDFSGLTKHYYRLKR